MVIKEDSLTKKNILEKLSIYDDAPFAIQSLDGNGKILYVNKEWLIKTGYKRKEIIGKLVSSIFTVEGKKEFKKRFVYFLKEDKVKDVRFDIVKKNNKIMNAAFEGRFFYDKFGKPVYSECIIRDVTDYVKKMEELKISEEKFRNIVTHTNEIIFMIDKKGVFTLSEGRGLEALGFKPGQVVGTSVFDLYKDNPNIIKDIKSSLRGKDVTNEVKVNNILFDVFYSPLKDSEGKIAGIIGMATNVTKTKQALDELERSQKIAKMGRWNFDIKNNVLDLSDITCEIFGISKKYFSGKMKSFYDIVHPDDLEFVKTEYAKSLKTKKRYDIVHRIVTKKNEVKYIREVFRTFYDGDEAKRSEGIAQDVTEIKRIEEELKIKNQEKKAILSNVPVGIIVVNEEGMVDYVNEAMLKISSASYERFKSINFLKHKNYIKHGLNKNIKNVFKGNSFRVDNVEYTSEIGKKTIRNFIGIPTLSKNRKQALIFVEDITELKKTEEISKKTAEEWSEIFDAMSDGVSIHSNDFTILNVNKAICKLLGVNKNELIDRKCFKIFHGNNKCHKNCPLHKSSYTKLRESVEIYEPKLGKWLNITVTPLEYSHGEILKFIHVVRDVSLNKKFEKELEERNEDLEKFNALAIGRELKMIEMKKKINKLEKKIK